MTIIQTNTRQDAYHAGIDRAALIAALDKAAKELALEWEHSESPDDHPRWQELHDTAAKYLECI